MAENALLGFAASFDNSDIGNNYNVVPANSYTLGTTPSTSITYSPQIGTVPIIGSNINLRSYSPFTISVLPPLLYLQNPDLLFGTVSSQNGQVRNLGLITKASIGNLTNFRDTVSQLRSQREDNSQLTTLPLTQPSSADRKVVGGRNTNRPIGGSGGNTSNNDRRIQYQIATEENAQDIANQLNRILNIPPLTLYINPTSFGVNYNKVQQYSERSRTQYIYQAWGEEQPKLSISGRIGAFLCGKATQNATAPSGVQFASKRDSASFQQLMNLLTFFKNNGYIQDTIGKTIAPQLIGILSIDYDQMTYLGYMDSFNWGYTETAQNGGLEFSFEFTVTQMYDNAQSNKVAPLKSPTPSPSDPRYGNQLGTTSIGNSRGNLKNEPLQLSPLNFGPVVTATMASQTTLPVSGSGFRTISATATPATPNTVPIQPFFDPSTV